MESSAFIDIGLPVALFIIMIGMGLTLAPRDFREVFVYPRASAFGSVVQVAVLPLFALAIAWAMSLPPALAVGLVLIAACPGGTTSNIFTFLARGNLALSITLTVVASLVTVLSLPWFVNLALDLFSAPADDVAEAAESLRLPVVRTVVTLLVIVICPVVIGMAIRAVKPDIAARLERAVGLFGLVVLAVLIVVIVLQLGGDAWPMFEAAGIAAVLLNLAGIAAGLIGGRLIGLDLRDALTCAMELGIKNGTLGLLVALTLLDSPEIAVPSAVYGMLMFAFGALLIGFGRWRLPVYNPYARQEEES